MNHLADSAARGLRRGGMENVFASGLRAVVCNAPWLAARIAGPESKIVFLEKERFFCFFTVFYLKKIIYGSIVDNKFTHDSNHAIGKPIMLMQTLVPM